MTRLIMMIFVLFVFFSQAYAQSNGTIRKNELERVKLSEIPIAGFDEPRPGDSPPITEAAHTYDGYVYAIRDADTIRGYVDLGFNIRQWFDYRYYGIDSFEITKKGGRSKSHVDRGFYCRDLMATWLGYKGDPFPKKSTYHSFPEPIHVIVESNKSDKYAGRWLFTVHKDGVNLNQLAARSGCSIVTTFGSKPVYFDRDTPITRELE